jgi:two-component system response regulator CpxR
MQQNKALIIDDNDSSALILEEVLEFEGFDVITSYSAKCGLYKARSDFDVDIILINPNLAKVSGFALLKEIRKTLSTPVILVGLKKEHQLKRALQYEASDFIEAPYEIEDVITKANEVVSKQDYSCIGKMKPRVKLGAFELNNLRYTLNIHGIEVNLTPKEFLIVQLLITNYDHVVTKEKISEVVFKKSLGQHDRSIDTHISNIRKKIACHSTLRVIRTIRGFGYLFCSTE